MSIYNSQYNGSINIKNLIESDFIVRLRVRQFEICSIHISLVSDTRAIETKNSD